VVWPGGYVLYGAGWRPGISQTVWTAEGKTALTPVEVRRFVLPVAEQVWRAWALGTGPDPRVPPVASLAVGRAVDLIEQWWTRADRDALKSAHGLRVKRHQVERWLGNRPAADLLKIDTYDVGWHTVLPRFADRGGLIDGQ